MLNHKSVKCYIAFLVVYIWYASNIQSFFILEKLFWISLILILMLEVWKPVCDCILKLCLEQGRTGFEIWLRCFPICLVRKHKLIFPICIICKMELIMVVMGMPGWLSDWASAFGSGHDPGAHRLPAWSLLLALLVSLPLSLCFSWINKENL